MGWYYEAGKEGKMAKKRVRARGLKEAFKKLLEGSKGKGGYGELDPCSAN